MKKMLVLGGSHAEIPLINAAKKQGYFVITTGNQVDGIGHKYADRYIPCDFSDKDAILKLAKSEAVDAICSGCNDFAYLSTAYACDKLSIPGHDSFETAKLIHHKDSFRNLTKRLGIRTPKVFTCKSEKEIVNACNEIGFPVIVKPIDLTGGKGVLRCETIEEAMRAFRSAMKCTRENCVVVEQFIIGSNHGCSMLLKNHQVVGSVFDDEQYYINRYLVAGASMPSSIVTDSVKNVLIHDVELIAQSLNLVDGLFHTQFMVDEYNNPIMIDPCRRAPGDLYIVLASCSSGIDWADEIVRAESGQEIGLDYSLKSEYIARECIMTDRTGKIREIHISPIIQEKVIYENIWGKVGDIIEDPLKYKAGILIFKCKDEFQLKQLIEEYHQLVYIDVMEG